MHYSRNPYLRLPTFWSGFTNVIDLMGGLSFGEPYVKRHADVYDAFGDDIDRLREDFDVLSQDYFEAVERVVEAESD